MTDRGTQTDRKSLEHRKQQTTSSRQTDLQEGDDKNPMNRWPVQQVDKKSDSRQLAKISADKISIISGWMKNISRRMNKISR